MDGGSLLKALQANKICAPFVRGIYFLDTLADSEPLLDPNQRWNLVVINTGFLNKASENRLQHWLAVGISETRQSVFLDSYSKQPSFYGPELTAFLERNTSGWDSCPFRIQAPSSTICGLYILQLSDLLCRSDDLTGFFDKFHRNFSATDLDLNGRRAHLWFSQTYGLSYTKFLHQTVKHPQPPVTLERFLRQWMP